MSPKIYRIKTFFLPFLWILLLFITGYSFLNWLLFTHYAVFPVREEILDVGLPVVLSLVPAWVWMWPRIKMFSLREKADGLYYFVVILGVVIPSVITQSYIRKLNEGLVKLNTISEITQYHADAYQVNKLYIDKRRASSWSYATIEGKNSTAYVYHIYIAAPLLNDVRDTVSTQCAAWYGVRYRATISNRLSEEEKDRQCRQYALLCEQQFQAADLKDFVYLERLGNTNQRPLFLQAAARNLWFQAPENIVLMPVKESFGIRADGFLPWIFGTVAAFLALWLVMCLYTELKIPEQMAGKQPPDWRWPATHLLAWMMGSSLFFGLITHAVAYGLTALGASSRPLVQGGQWWRLLLSIFLNITILQGFYTVVFYLAGYILEPLLKWKWLLLWLVCGLAGNIMSIVMNPDYLFFGASGAVLGCWGFLLVFIFAGVFSKDTGTNLLYAIGCLAVVVLGLLLGLKGTSDSAADLGGLACGILLGILYYRKHRDLAVYKD
ncbi:rhomboid family intramembrane serine protease [Chitinophaga sp. HK235]|uniref:rhomboid family intramembrane serine protease n=1 Tax=Chitinophaga sp. HK235 TaxID=2952571 RepID=UPI001BAE0C98|nr:rhomboid family intramembrane serine protease [Chitinophaga sp. HK235]